MSSDETFSSFLKLTPVDFVRAGLLNQPLLKDASFYTDIFKFKDSGVPEFKDSYQNFLSHFSKFFALVRASKRNGLSQLSSGQVSEIDFKTIKAIYKEADPAYKAAFNNLEFKEVDGFNLGYSKSLSGSSIGPRFKVQLIKAAQELLELNIDDPEVFCLLPFLQEGIGCDRISDMFISINYSHFLKFTERKLKELGIPGTRRFHIEGADYDLIKPNPFKNPLILIPKNLVKRLPITFVWSDIFDCYDENSALRSRLDQMILSHYNKKSDVTKANVSSLLKGDPSLLRKIVVEFKETTSLSQLEREVIEGIELELKDLKVPDAKTLKDQVLFIINTFRMYVERRGIWKLFYHRTKDEHGEKVRQPLSEEHVQRAFYLVADLIGEKFQIEVTPEYETGCGPVDFKFSQLRASILVEIKLSTHRDIRHGFVTQLEEYVKSERPEHSFFVLVKVTNSDPKVMEVDTRRMHRLSLIAKGQKDTTKELIVIDASIRQSASKI